MAEPTMAAPYQPTEIAVRDDRLVVMKHRPPGDTRPIEAEADWLRDASGRRCGHPVVSPAGFDPTTGRLATVWAGGSTLASSNDPRHAAAVLAAVADAVGRLHLDGLVHGNLTAEHVIVCSERFRLCRPTGPDRPPCTDRRPEDADLGALHTMVGGLLATWKTVLPGFDPGIWTALPDDRDEFMALGPHRLRVRLWTVRDRSSLRRPGRPTAGEGPFGVVRRRLLPPAARRPSRPGGPDRASGSGRAGGSAGSGR